MKWSLFQRICEKNSKNDIKELFLCSVVQQTLNTTKSGGMTPHYFNLCTGWLRVVRFVETWYPQPVWHHHHHVLSYDMYIAPSKRVLQTVRSSSSSFTFQYLLVPLRPSSSCLRLLPLLLVPYSFPSVFPSITCLEGSYYVRCDQ